MQKEELRKRDAEIVELTNETVKSSNEFSKKMALVEQERDFLRNEINNLKDNLQRKELDLQDFSKQLREREDRVKSYKQKRKLAEKEATELRQQRDRLES